MQVFFNWVLPFGFLFLLRSWMAKRMAAGTQGFLNIGGNRVRAPIQRGQPNYF
jgi:hypothetical protein